jgi:hypothetical protein
LPAKRTADDLYVLVETHVLPEIKEVKGDIKDIRANLTRAGLDNGHAADVKVFFDRRAKRQAALEWLGDLLRPVTRFKVLVYVVGFLSTIAWGAIAVIDLMQLLKPAHFPGG